MQRSVLLAGNFLSATLGTLSVGEDLSNHLEQAGWRVLRTSPARNRLKKLVDMVSTTWRRHREYEVAAIEVYSGPAFTWAECVCAAAQRRGKPIVLTLHGGNLPQFAAKNPDRIKRLLSKAVVVTAPSPYLYRAFKPFRDDLILLPNALDLERYSHVHRELVQPRLVWLRAFHEIYNPALAPRIVAALRDEFPNITLRMYGPDKDGSRATVERVTRELGLESQIEMPGAVPKEQVPQALNCGDIFLNTTNFDNTPVSVCEAMACGLIVVSTNVGGIPDLVKDGEEGLLVPPDDCTAMVQAVRRVLRDAELAKQLSANARRKAETLGWQEILPRWEELLSSVSTGAD